MSDATMLIINDQQIPLSDLVDVRSLITDVMNALLDGGGFVHIDGRHGVEYDVLITSATQVMIRHSSMTFEAGTVAGPWTSSIDLDI